MPRTKIFKGIMHSNTAYGSVQFFGFGRKAQIIFSIKKTNKEIHCALEACSLSSLNHLFLDVIPDVNDTNLPPTNWYIKINGDNAILYSPDAALAYVLTTTHYEEELPLFLASHLPKIGYFNELKFSQFLATKDLSIDRLRDRYGMGEKRIQFLIENYRGVRQLVKFGVAFTDLNLLPLSQIKRRINQLNYSEDSLLYLASPKIEKKYNGHNPNPLNYNPRMFPERRAINSAEIVAHGLDMK